MTLRRRCGSLLERPFLRKEKMSKTLPFFAALSTSASPLICDQKKLIDSFQRVKFGTHNRRVLFIKRDDLLWVNGVNGNKARKLFRFGRMSPFPRHVISYGGVQSNSMLAVATIVSQHKGSRFYYFTKKIPSQLEENPSGNFAAALSRGMEVMELGARQYEIVSSIQELSPRHFDLLLEKDILNKDLSKSLTSELCCWLPQGGAMKSASEGCFSLGEEILLFLRSLQNPDLQRTSCVVYVESGTGATARYLQEYISHRSRQLRSAGGFEWKVSIVAVSCVMPGSDLQEAMSALSSASSTSQNSLPQVLSSKNVVKSPFGVPRRKLYDLWKRLHDETGIVFDLLYSPRAFEQIFQWWGDRSGEDEAVHIYLHCGGVEGNGSQLERYAFKRLISAEELKTASALCDAAASSL